jgi:DNA-binding LacI/PurR family transcriptional regulator
MPEKVTIGQIADQCGVSISTVSLALNNKPGISEAIRAQVKEAARRMGYSLKTPLASVQHKKLGSGQVTSDRL